MGGCCFSSKSVALDGGQQGSQNVRYPHASLDHEPFSLHGISVESTDVLVDTNLGTNTQLLPSAETLDVGLVHIPHDAVDTSDKTSPVQIADAQPIEDTLSGMREDLKRSDVKILDDPLSGPPVDEKNSKLDGPFPLVNDEEDVCPICLEEYDKENPRVVSNCGHHFHLSCILEWMERSDSCAVCNQAMLFNEEDYF
ncbi:probable E3 ubiquitin-protein ligase RHB1A isoform X1 [Nymphaea colorata]|uniref:probable E3 ubiquitin-protein ligase RHB1A isoform X1 n=1 Tax=Nymphaea colorata TaxID=210225 RepID=UPI00129DCF8B|nr:probable E3 ubiquitin-protein ligase RHB1A isoform X1 [Nymphaea colorata]